MSNKTIFQELGQNKGIRDKETERIRIRIITSLSWAKKENKKKKKIKEKVISRFSLKELDPKRNIWVARRNSK